MIFQDFIVPPSEIRTENWQLGSLISNEIEEGSIVLLFVSDYRGGGGQAALPNAFGNTFISFQSPILKFLFVI